ncbi:hypothetical protein IRT45_32870 [Nocardia sp. BSTN01]|nr:hypothetical protein [Nocardia sp. BSTN01]MBF5001915.1 hypothetical protein [Nocardia sp. BSTN01]
MQRHRVVGTDKWRNPAQRTGIWGESSTAIASYSTHFGAYDLNMFI